MASSLRFLYSRSVIFTRLLRPKSCAQKSVQFSSLREPPKFKPVQYSTNKAAKLSIAEILGFNTKQKSNINWISPVLAVIITASLVYIFFIRTEENELDEFFSKGLGSNTETAELIDLKLKYHYCKNNNLPTDFLKAKIDEIESRQPVKKPFRL